MVTAGRLQYIQRHLSRTYDCLGSAWKRANTVAGRAELGMSNTSVWGSDTAPNASPTDNHAMQLRKTASHYPHCRTGWH